MTSPTGVGEKFRSSGYTIGDPDLSWFSALSLDAARLHTDAAYSARSVFGRRVGHGLLGMCLADGLLNRERGPAVPVAWEWQFLAPFFVGDTIFAEATITAQEAAPPLTITVETVEVFKNDGILIQRGRRKRAMGRAEQDWVSAALRPAVEGFAFVHLAPDEDVPPSTADGRFADETGIFFEDLQDGDSFESFDCTVNEMHAGVFSSMTGQTDGWLYGETLDDEGNARQLVSPIFGLALVEGLKNMLAPNAGVGTPMASLSWRWRPVAPIFVGDRLRLEVKIEGRRASRSKTDRGMIAQSIALICAGRGTVQHGQHVQMFRRRPP